MYIWWKTALNGMKFISEWNWYADQRYFDVQTIWIHVLYENIRKTVKFKKSHSHTRLHTYKNELLCSIYRQWMCSAFNTTRERKRSCKKHTLRGHSAGKVRAHSTQTLLMAQRTHKLDPKIDNIFVFELSTLSENKNMHRLFSTKFLHCAIECAT